MSYKAFMSYSHAADGKLAPALQSALHRFAKPWYKLRAMRVFRDESNLTDNPDAPGLWSAIVKALGDSEHFILLASPTAAKSRWVQDEVALWLAQHGDKKLHLVLTEGEISWDRTTNDFDWSKTTSLPKSLEKVFREEPWFADLRFAHTATDLSLRNPDFSKPVSQLAARIRQLALDKIIGEDVRQYRNFKRVAWLAGIALFLLTIFASYQRDQALQQSQLANDNEANAEKSAGDARIAKGKEKYQKLFALEQREEAVRQTNRALARYLSTKASLVLDQSAEALERATLLSLESYLRLPSFESDKLLRENAQRLMIPLKTTPLGIGSHGFRKGYHYDLSEGGEYFVTATPRGHKNSALTFSAVSQSTPMKSIEVEGSIRKIKLCAGAKRVAIKRENGPILVLDAPGWSPVPTDIPSSSYYLIFSRNCRYVVFLHKALDGKKGELYNIDEQREVHSFPAAEDLKTSWLAFSPEGEYLAIVKSNEKVLILETATGKEVFTVPLSEPIIDVTAIALSKKAESLVIAGISGKGFSGGNFAWIIHPRDMMHNLQELNANTDQNAITHFAFSENGALLASTSGGNTGRIWKTNSGLELFRMNHEGITHITFLSDDRVATAGRDGTARLWRLPDTPPGLGLIQIAYELKGLSFMVPGSSIISEQVSFAYLTPRLDHLFTSYGDGILSVTNIGNVGEKISVVDIAAKPFSRNGIALGTPRNFPMVESSSSAFHFLNSHFSSNGNYVAYPITKGQRDNVAVVDFRASQPIGAGISMARMTSFALMPNGHTLIAVHSVDNETERTTISERDVKSGQPVRSFDYKGRILGPIAVSSDGRRLAFLSSDDNDKIKGIEVWQIQPFSHIQTFPAKSEVQGIALNQAGTQLAVFYPQNTDPSSVVVWNVADHSVCCDIHLGKRFIRQLNFVPESNNLFLLMDGNEGFDFDNLRESTLHELMGVIIPISVDAIQKETCRRVTKNLKEEWRQYFGDEPYRKTCPNLP